MQDRTSSQNYKRLGEIDTKIWVIEIYSMYVYVKMYAILL